MQGGRLWQGCRIAPWRRFRKSNAAAPRGRKGGRRVAIRRPHAQSEMPGGMSASLTPTSSMLVMMVERMKPRPLL